MSLEKIEVGKKYKNIHSDMICKVRAKVFFNIYYCDITKEMNDSNSRYVHYSTFRKNWVEI